MGPYQTVLDTGGVAQALQKMTLEILETHDAVGKLILIGIKTRGVFLAKRIQRQIREIKRVEIPTGEIDITMYRDDWTPISHHPVVAATDILFSIDGKEVILVDDVLYTGRTTRAAMDAVIRGLGFQLIPIMAPRGKLIAEKQPRMKAQRMSVPVPGISTTDVRPSSTAINGEPRRKRPWITHLAFVQFMSGHRSDRVAWK